MGFCSCTVKYFLFFFNFIIVVCGLALIVVGSLALKNQIHLPKFIDHQQFTPASIAIIVIGVIIFLIAFFGCCGAIQESSCLITTYAVLLLTLLVVEFIIGIIAFVYHNKIQEEFEKEFKNSLEKNYEGIQDLQKELGCCGVNNYKDYEHYMANGTLPKSCCEDQSSKCTTSSKTKYEIGCKQKLIDFIKTHLKEIGGVAIGFAVVEVLGVIMSCCLASHYRRGKKMSV